MKKVILKPLQHREMECIGIYFENSSSMNGVIRKNADAKWSQTNKCWYIPLNKEHYNKLSFALRGLAEIEQSALYEYLANKKKKDDKLKIPAKAQNIQVLTKAETVFEARIKKGNLPAVSNNVTNYKPAKIQAVNAHVLPAMQQKLKLKAYSGSTIKTYVNEMTQLLQILNGTSADDLTPEHLRRYLVYCYEKLKLTENTLHSRINAFYPVGLKK